jgi:hypothetical protein
MTDKNTFLNDCEWLARNLEDCPPLTDFFTQGTKCIRALANGQWEVKNLQMARIFTSAQSYLYWIHDFPLEEYSWSVSPGELVRERMSDINAAARAYLADLGCTPENDWGRKANPPIV